METHTSAREIKVKPEFASGNDRDRKPANHATDLNARYDARA
jgi:hypothetical protein